MFGYSLRDTNDPFLTRAGWSRFKSGNWLLKQGALC